MSKKNEMSAEEYLEYRRKICRESQRRRRIVAKANGICIICCKRPAREGRKTCAECSGHYCDVKYRNRREYEQAGMCLRCGKRPPIMYRKWCQECADYIAEYNRRQKNDRALQ